MRPPDDQALLEDSLKLLEAFRLIEDARIRQTVIAMATALRLGGYTDLLQSIASRQARPPLSH